jgi:two-component system cell cycle response regulator
MTARVLVVDDSLPNRKLLEARLQDEYFEVLGAASAAEAITLAQRWSPDIILLDVLMPVMDGFEACRRLKAQPATAHIPVVMVTSLNDQSERVRGLDAGADGQASGSGDAFRQAARAVAREAGAGCLAPSGGDRARSGL